MAGNPVTGQLSRPAPLRIAEDIEDAARALMADHGKEAEIKALERAGVSKATGSDESAEKWRQVYRAIGLLRAGAL